jgi:mono/diheme cytochrome c family protein
MSSAFYRSAEWRRLRAECIRLHPTCATAGCGQPSRVADHVIPRTRGGADALHNLVGRCITCHNARRGTAEPVLRGCDAAGNPRDAGHWWHKPTGAKQEYPPNGSRDRENTFRFQSLRAGGWTASHPPDTVSSSRRRRR